MSSENTETLVSISTENTFCGPSLSPRKLVDTEEFKFSSADLINAIWVLSRV